MKHIRKILMASVLFAVSIFMAGCRPVQMPSPVIAPYEIRIWQVGKPSLHGEIARPIMELMREELARLGFQAVSSGSISDGKTLGYVGFHRFGINSLDDKSYFVQMIYNLERYHGIYLEIVYIGPNKSF